MKVLGETCGVTVLKNIQHIPCYIRVSRFISGLGAVTITPSLDFLVGDRRHICSLSVINKNKVNHTTPHHTSTIRDRNAWLCCTVGHSENHKDPLEWLEAQYYVLLS
jgi:hypothetical protein